MLADHSPDDGLHHSSVTPVDGDALPGGQIAEGPPGHVAEVLAGLGRIDSVKPDLDRGPVRR